MRLVIAEKHKQNFIERKLKKYINQKGIINIHVNIFIYQRKVKKRQVMNGLI